MKQDPKNLIYSILIKYNKKINSEPMCSLSEQSNGLKRDLILASLYIHDARVHESCYFLNMNRSSFTINIKKKNILGVEGFKLYQLINEHGMSKQRKDDRLKLIEIIREELISYF